EEETGAAAGRLEMRRGQPDLDLAAAVAGAIPELLPPGGRRRELAVQQLHDRRRQLQHVDDVASERRARWHAGDGFGRTVEGEDDARRIGGDEAARQAVDD